MIPCSPPCSRRRSLRPGATRWNWCATSATALTGPLFLKAICRRCFLARRCRNFGVRDLLDTLIAHAPPPRDQQARQRVVHANEDKMSGIVFKIQANMDPNHRDRIAFMRLASGKLTRGMRVKIVRTGKTLALNAPQFFFAQDRSLAEEAFAGDVVGIPNHGVLRIGDTLTEGEDIVFTGVPSFAPEILRRVKLGDPMKAKKLRSALEELGRGRRGAALHPGGWLGRRRGRGGRLAA